MVRPYSSDLRERVLAAVSGGAAIRAVAVQFGVSPSFVSKLHTRYRQTRSVAPDRQGGDHRSGPIEAHADWLLAQVDAVPDITLAELCHGLGRRGLQTTTSTVSRFLHRRGLTYKKRRHMRASRRGPT
jgi:transposase